MSSGATDALPASGYDDPKQIVQICAWCPDARARTVALKAEGKIVSHGICPTCAEKWVKGER